MFLSCFYTANDFQQWLLLATAVAASYGSYVQSTSVQECSGETQEKGKNKINVINEMKTGKMNEKYHSTEKGLDSKEKEKEKEKYLDVFVTVKHWQHAQRLEDERRRRIRILKQTKEIKHKKVNI